MSLIKHCYSSRWSKKNSQLVRLWGFFVAVLCISYWRMKYKNVETSKQNKKYFYRLRVTIITHPEIVFEKWVSPKMVQETGKKMSYKKYVSTAAFITLFISSCHYHKNKDGFQRRLAEKKNSNVFIIKLFVFTQLQGCCFVGRKFFSTFSVVFFSRRAKIK